MTMTINTNISSLNAQRNSAKVSDQLSTAMSRLSSGLRINSAKDDAAGLAISERMTSQVRGLNQAARNANDGISLAQTAEGALASVGDNLQRIRELAVQSANATNSSSDRVALQKEVTQLSAEIDRVATQTQFNGINLLDGSFSAQQFQVGANAGQTISVASISNARSSALGQFQGYTLSNQSIGTASNTAAAQSVTVGGVTTQLGTIANDAKALASAINASGVTGLSATANATVVAAGTSAVTGTASGNATFTLNGLAITVAGTTNAATNRANTVSAFNAQSSVTGVVAADTGSGVSLTAADGRNIAYSFAAGTGGASTATTADFGIATPGANPTAGTLNITYNAPSGTTGNVAFAGAFANSTAIAATGTSVAAIDISTLAGANAALGSVDAALATINSNRADLGAMQNRFSSAISNLQSTNQNLSAARSRIQDADFASETSSLSRAQVLQQAATAMVAQANQLPQQVLQLLR